MQNFKEMEDLIKSSGLKTDEEQQGRILDDSFAALERIRDTRLQTKEGPGRGRIVKYKWTEMAAAAAIIVVVFSGLWYFHACCGNSSVAWAQVADNVRQIETFTYRQRSLAKEMEQAETIHYYSRQYGFRLGIYNNEKINMRKFILPAKKVMITVMPQEKKYEQAELTEKEYNELQQFHDPRKLIEQFMSSEYTELECRKIDGAEACGIETRGLNLSIPMVKITVGRLWVNTNNNLPVRMELEGFTKDGNKIKIVTDEFRWGAKLHAGDFAPDIDSDYKLNEQ